MILIDRQVKQLLKDQNIVIDPYFELFQGPNLYYCHLGDTFLVPKQWEKALNPLEAYNKDEYFEKQANVDSFVLEPGQFVLAETFEYLGTGAQYVMRLLNSSSLARIGVSQCALGMINPGCGIKKPHRPTLELVNNAPFPVELVSTQVKKNKVVRWGTEVLKIAVEQISEPIQVLYEDWSQSIYGTQKNVTTSQMHRRFQGADKLPIHKDSRYYSS